MSDAMENYIEFLTLKLTILIMVLIIFIQTNYVIKITIS